MRCIAVWICFCAYLNCAGWVLSALHELNPAGYAVTLLFGFGALVVWRKRTSRNFLPKIHWPRLRRRFRKPFPTMFLLVTCLVFLGGALYAPANYDGLTYRLPRMLNWLAAGHWFWIPTINDRMNYSTPAWEWTALPFFAVLHSDRGLFLINALGFLLMPGLLFSVFRRVGATRRMAWTWMWIFPLAYGYATQASSIGNDFTGVVFGLASVYFGLRARRSQRVEDVWLAGLAAALMTGTKLSNLPLLLPCLVAVWPALAQLRKRWRASLAVAGAAVLISAVPTIVMNQLYTGSWTGDPENLGRMQVNSPAAAFLGNSLLLAQQSFMPPALPDARRVDGWLNKKLPAAWRQTLKEKFPRYGAYLRELPQEESAGLGLGVTLLLLAGAGAAACGFGWKKSKAKWFSAASLVGFAAWISALFFMVKLGSEAAPRLMLPYYPLVALPILLLPAHDRLLRFRAWRIFASLAALSVLPAIIFSPSCPLFPARPVAERLVRRHPDSAVARRLAMVYSTYAHRNDLLAPLRAVLPNSVRNIGFVAGSDDTDYSLWRPFGRRRVVYLQTSHRKSLTLPSDVKWIVVRQTMWPDACSVPLEEWAARHHAKIVLSVPIVALVSRGEETWCLLHVETL